ncbi:hypothetical protein [Rhodopila sp.]|uniref:hypothetical protein n=1 Tax=Rhodopila sp. TaxID=2480087 RepID=UPI003D10A633
MFSHHHWRADDSEDRDARRQTASLAGVAITLLLLVGGLFLVQQLRSASVIGDCLMSGRRNCDVLMVGSH